MNFKNRAFALIGISIIAAIAILVASFLLGDRDSSQTVTYIIIAIWWIPFSIFVSRASKEKKDNDSQEGQTR